MRVIVGMSGGVDSSVAAALLSRAGHEVVGVSLQLYDRSGAGQMSRCCSPADLIDARRVADRLGFPYYVINREGLFERRVLDDFIREYRAGRTPNPCVHCNADVKFETLAALAADLGAEAVATGHYARVGIDPKTGERHLRRAADPEKDQSYFLFDLSRDQLRLAHFPLGAMRKEEVRRVARSLDLPVADKPDSQDVCFLDQGGYRRFVARRLSERGEAEPAGHVVGPDGRVLGTHDGLSGYTIGQRRGLGVASGTRLYVIGMDPTTRAVRLGPREALAVETLILSGVRIHGEPRGAAFDCTVQVRYRHAGVPARVTRTGRDTVRVDLRQPVTGVSPGQAAVFYDGDLVLGGGWIEREEAARAGSEARAGCATIGAVERA